MIKIRKSSDRGHFDHGWLNTYHTFSFADYYDPDFMGFRSLRVINEDWVQAGEGFPTHAHRDMEIITYVLEGALEHKDSMKNGSIIAPGDVQRMSAGTGVTHSEYNHSRSDPVHLLQIWILPERKDIPPGYEQKSFDVASREGKLRLIASQNGRDGSVTVHQDVCLFSSVLKKGQAVEHGFGLDRHGWIQVARGGIFLNEREMKAGDGAALSGEKKAVLRASEDAEILLFDLS